MNTTTRRRLQRGVIILPSAFTLGNLFLGIWAIVSAARGHFELAGWLIVMAAFADLFDGRIARFTSTGSEFGAQLDSLVDAISFGVAPSLIIYFAFLSDTGWNWVVSFIYVTAAVIRLARFNVEQAGSAKVSFHGLPSPTAGVTLATYFAFTETEFFGAYLAEVNRSQAAVWLTVAVAGLMVSQVLYPVVPRLTVRTRGGRFALFMALASVTAAFTVPEYFFFPFALTYIAYGMFRTVVLGFLERLPERDPLLDEYEGEEDEIREMDYHEIPAPAPIPPPRPSFQGGFAVSAYQVEVRIVPREGILDPQGKAVGGALASLGFAGVGEVHVGRLVRLDLEADSETAAQESATAMCRQLLANPVTEDFDVRVVELSRR